MCKAILIEARTKRRVVHREMEGYQEIRQALCKSCKYHVTLGASGEVACYYAVRMEHSRTKDGDPPGLCTHYVRGRTNPANYNHRERL